MLNLQLKVFQREFLPRRERMILTCSKGVRLHKKGWGSFSNKTKTKFCICVSNSNQPEHRKVFPMAATDVVVPFTDYSRWERRPIKHSPSVRAKQQSPQASRLAAPRYPPCAHGKRLGHELEHSTSYTRPAATTKQNPSALQYSHASLHGGQSKPSSPTRKVHRRPEPPAVAHLKVYAHIIILCIDNS